MTERESQNRQPDDPSMEEILASIRRIVFENDGKDDGGDGARDGDSARDGDGAGEAAGMAEEPAQARSPAGETGQPDRTVEPDSGAAQAGESSGEDTGEDSGEDGGEDRSEDGGETSRGDAGFDPPADAVSPEPRKVGPAAESPGDRAAPAGPARQEASGPAAGPDSAATGPDEPVLLLTEMIAPDGSVVRIEPKAMPAPKPLPDEQTPPQDGEMSAGPVSGFDSGIAGDDRALGTATQDELAAMLRDWLDRNAPDMIDRAARREVRKLADRQD